MEENLTLQVLLDAAFSGHLKQFDIRPFERKFVLKLNMALQWYYRAKLREQTMQDLLVSLTRQVCMAVGNRSAYSDAVSNVRSVLEHADYLLLLGNKKGNSDNVDTSWQVQLAKFWEKCYGMSIAEANAKGL